MHFVLSVIYEYFLNVLGDFKVQKSYVVKVRQNRYLYFIESS